MRTIQTPDESIFVTTDICMNISLSVIGLITAEDISFDTSFRRRLNGNDIYHTCQGITSVHQGCRAFQYFYPAGIHFIYFNTMLISPLLAFLPDAIIDHYYPVISQSANKRF